MGQFLAIGLATNIRVDKREKRGGQLSLEQLQENMKQELYYEPEIYTAVENEDFFSFQLNEDVLYGQLIPFLKLLYPLLYDNNEYYDDILKRLKTLPSEKWLEWADLKPEEAFQFDKHAEPDYLNNEFSQICVNSDFLMLSMEGKILMESYGRQFKFLKYTMTQSFKQFTLAGALQIYITG